MNRVKRVRYIEISGIRVLMQCFLEWHTNYISACRVEENIDNLGYPSQELKKKCICMLGIQKNVFVCWEYKFKSKMAHQEYNRALNFKAPKHRYATDEKNKKASYLQRYAKRIKSEQEDLLLTCKIKSISVEIDEEKVTLRSTVPLNCSEQLKTVSYFFLKFNHQLIFIVTLSDAP